MTRTMLTLLCAGSLLLASPIYSSDDAMINADLAMADINKNGMLEAEEVNTAIMQYLTGDSSWNEELIAQMIELCLDTH